MEPLPPLPRKGLASVTKWRRSQNEKGKKVKKKKMKEERRKNGRIREERERKRCFEYCRSQNAVGHKIWGEGVANCSHTRPWSYDGETASGDNETKIRENERIKGK